MRRRQVEHGLGMCGPLRVANVRRGQVMRADSRGAAVSFERPGKSGLFQVTLSAEAWVDLVQNGVRVKSTACA